MITTLICKIISVFIGLISFIIPDWSLPDYIMESFEGIYYILSIANGIFPINASIKVLILIIAFEGALAIARLVSGLLSLIRGGGKLEI